MGQSRAEEIDFARRGHGRGANYGWRPFEGHRHVYAREHAPAAVAPVLSYPHTRGQCAITGGYVVRDLALRELVGQYLYGDFCTGQIRAVRLTDHAAKQDRVAWATRALADLLRPGRRRTPLRNLVLRIRVPTRPRIGGRPERHGGGVGQRERCGAGAFDRKGLEFSDARAQ
ncbi:MAG: hypothetical protein M3065_19050 [Actinomycetota bacterium]|nr:hypothetical protein [Actinomycetota bacterium]